MSHFETLIHLMVETLTIRAQRCHESQRPMQRHTGIEKTMMSTVLGMLMMMPVVFVVGGYALVSRRP